MRQLSHDHQVVKCKHGTIIMQCRCMSTGQKAERVGPCPTHCVVQMAEVERAQYETRTRDAAHRATDHRPSYFTCIGRESTPGYVSPRDEKSQQRTDTTLLPRVQATVGDRIVYSNTEAETAVMPSVPFSNRDALATTTVAGIARVPAPGLRQPLRGLRRLQAALNQGG